MTIALKGGFISHPQRAPPAFVSFVHANCAGLGTKGRNPLLAVSRATTQQREERTHDR